MNDEWQDFATRFGLQLHRLRIAKGMTQAAVADRAGLTRYTYQRYERGESLRGAPSNPTLLTILALSQVFEVQVQDLLPPNAPNVTVR